MEFYIIVVIFCHICAIDGQNAHQQELKKIIELNLRRDAQDRTNYKLISMIISNIIEEESIQNRQRVENCIALSTSRKIYSRCVKPLIEKQYEYLMRESVAVLYGNSTLSIHENRHRSKKSITNSNVVQNEEEHNGVTWSSMFENVGEFLYHVIKSTKSTIGGSWFSSSKDDSGTSDSFDDQDMQVDMNQTANDVIALISQLLNSPLVALKENLSFDRQSDQELSRLFESILNDKIDSFQISHQRESKNDNFRILSPRLFPLFESKSNGDSFLSPDILALYDDRSSNNNGPSFSQILRNFSQTSEEKKDNKFWSGFLGELSGISDLAKLTKKSNLRKLLLKKSKIETGYGMNIPTKSIYDFYDGFKVRDIYRMLNDKQTAELNLKGYVFMENDQVDKVYRGKNQGLEVPSTAFDIKRYKAMSNIDKKIDLLDFVSQALNLSKKSHHYRNKRVASNDDPSNNETLISKNNPPCVAAPYLGGTALSTYVGAPQILCPSAFSYIVLGPLVLSPYILSPYIFGPFILSPLLLTPFVLSPYILSPNILTPIVLSPSVLNPTVLSPNILSPSLLSPSILSPSVLGPNILSPGVLSPGILSDGVLAPAVLSPCVLCKKKR